MLLWSATVIWPFQIGSAILRIRRVGHDNDSDAFCQQAYQMGNHNHLNRKRVKYHAIICKESGPCTYGSVEHLHQLDSWANSNWIMRPIKLSLELQAETTWIGHIYISIHHRIVMLMDRRGGGDGPLVMLNANLQMSQNVNKAIVKIIKFLYELENTWKL